MRVIHINVDRYNKIKDLGWKFMVSSDGSQASLYSGRIVYHLLQGEHDYCDTCQSEYDSVQVSTPVELEYAKL